MYLIGIRLLITARAHVPTVALLLCLTGDYIELVGIATWSIVVVEEVLVQVVIVAEPAEEERERRRRRRSRRRKGRRR
tara:strand:+ start:373 stop:606 length:234 start_codon:yes stop_codon:yes gene_type:complete